MDKMARTEAIKKRYEPKPEVLEIPVEGGRNIDCEMEDCKWNDGGKCKALAIDIKKDTEEGEGDEPICETYSPNGDNAGQTDTPEEEASETPEEEDAEDKQMREKAAKEIDDNNGGMSTQTKPIQVVNYYRRTNRPIS